MTVVFLMDPPSPILHKDTTGTMNLKINRKNYTIDEI